MTRAGDEPPVLPARFPNLLVNGAGGIAVGMATNIPPHNLGEVIDATLAMIDRQLEGGEPITLEELMAIVPGPDFPTGAMMLGQGGARIAYATGRGSIMMRATPRDRGRPERPPIDCSDRRFPSRSASRASSRRSPRPRATSAIEGVADIRDESNREGVRVVIELKRDATAEVVLNQLWRHTPAQSSFPANMLAIRGGRPEMMGLKDILVGLHHLPRGSDHAPLQVRAREGARPCAYLARPRRRGQQS